MGICNGRSFINQSAVVTWGDGKTNIETLFYSKGASKAMVNVQHGKLASAKDLQRKKVYWTVALDKLKKLLE